MIPPKSFGPWEPVDMPDEYEEFLNKVRSKKLFKTYEILPELEEFISKLKDVEERFKEYKKELEEKFGDFLFDHSNEWIIGPPTKTVVLTADLEEFYFKLLELKEDPNWKELTDFFWFKFLDETHIAAC